MTAAAGSRAVRRRIPSGTLERCPPCGEWVRFRARMHLEQIIANVYEDGKWARVEHFHPACYETAGEPYGEAAA